MRTASQCGYNCAYIIYAIIHVNYVKKTDPCRLQIPIVFLNCLRFSNTKTLSTAKSPGFITASHNAQYNISLL